MQDSDDDDDGRNILNNSTIELDYLNYIPAKKGNCVQVDEDYHSNKHDSQPLNSSNMSTSNGFQPTSSKALVSAFAGSKHSASKASASKISASKISATKSHATPVSVHRRSGNVVVNKQLFPRDDSDITASSKSVNVVMLNSTKRNNFKRILMKIIMMRLGVIKMRIVMRMNMKISGVKWHTIVH